MQQHNLAPPHNVPVHALPVGVCTNPVGQVQVYELFLFSGLQVPGEHGLPSQTLALAAKGRGNGRG